MSPKDLGQHWLHSDYLDKVIGLTDLGAGDHVLEIGPGPTGNLTEVLLGAGAHVTAVEFDKAVFDELESHVAKFYSQDRPRLTLVNQDILKFDLTQLPKNYKVVANIPYYLTGKILRLLTESANPPSDITLLVQKEVAERLAAEPGQLSVIGVAVQLFGEVGLGEVIPAHAFTPPPKVDSQVVHVVRRKQPLFPEADLSSMMRLIKAGFGEKRKKLRSSLSGGLHLDKASVDKWLDKAGIAPDARAQELSLQQWYELWQSQPV